MIEISRDAPGFVACGRSGRPLLGTCPNGHRRMVPFRLLKTGDEDPTPLYGRPFKCKACGSREVTLFALESQAELDTVRPSLVWRDHLPSAPTNYARQGPDKDLL